MSEFDSSSSISNINNEINSFKLLEKQVKECKHISDISNLIIDLSKYENNLNSSSSLTLNSTLTSNSSLYSIVNEKCSISLFGEEKKVYSFQGYDGLFVIKNSLPLWAQIEMSYLALSECPESPNTTSLGVNSEVLFLSILLLSLLSSQISKLIDWFVF